MGQVSSGFQINPDELSAGSAKINALLEQAVTTIAAIQSVFDSLQSAAPNQELGSALGEANATAADKFADLAVLYEYISKTLTSSANAYREAESDATARINAAGKGA
jgi:uncharacterized protein YukE